MFETLFLSREAGTAGGVGCPRLGHPLRLERVPAMSLPCYPAAALRALSGLRSRATKLSAASL